MVRVWLASLVGPELIPTNGIVCNPASSKIVTFVKVLRVGGSLTTVTVTRNVLVTESTPPLARPCAAICRPCYRKR